MLKMSYVLCYYIDTKLDISSKTN